MPEKLFPVSVVYSSTLRVTNVVVFFLRLNAMIGRSRCVVCVSLMMTLEVLTSLRQKKSPAGCEIIIFYVTCPGEMSVVNERGRGRIV